MTTWSQCQEVGVSRQPKCTGNRPYLNTRINTTQYLYLFTHHNLDFHWFFLIS